MPPRLLAALRCLRVALTINTAMRIRVAHRRPDMSQRAAILTTGAALLAALWFLPPALLPHPVTNQDIELSTAAFLVLLLALGGSLLAVPIGRRRNWQREGLIGLGAFWLALGPVAILALRATGKSSAAAFGPLLLMPFLTVPAGLVVAGAGLRRPDGGAGRSAWMAVARGLLAAALTAAWILARGAAEWRLAPYGLDVMVLAAVAAAGVLYLGAVRQR